MRCVRQILRDPAGDNMWNAEGAIDLSGTSELDGPLVASRHLGP